MSLPKCGKVVRPHGVDLDLLQLVVREQGAQVLLILVVLSCLREVYMLCVLFHKKTNRNFFCTSKRNEEG